MASYLRRRKFLAPLGGAASEWPLATSALQPERVGRISMSLPFTRDNLAAPAPIWELFQELEPHVTGEIERAVAAFARGSNGRLILVGSAFAQLHHDLIVTPAPRVLSTKHQRWARAAGENHRPVHPRTGGIP
jgi:hypothetical protein